jgi:hypothetical protein
MELVTGRGLDRNEGAFTIFIEPKRKGKRGKLNWVRE